MKKDKLKEILNNPKAVRIAVGAGLLAIVLIFLSSYIDFGSKSVDTEKFSAELSEQLLEILSSVEGVGEAKIFLTMDNTGENVYQNNSDAKVKSIAPTVRGVVVVCDGGDDPVVVERVLSAVTKSLDISSDKVSITKLRS
ncbi:MAG: hypothetical protein IJJ15_06765 [Ruminococcus sp.]|nr:hypothetical protein [Ruminococcus sp.]